MNRIIKYFFCTLAVGIIPAFAQSGPPSTICPTTPNTNSDCAFIITIGPGGSISGKAVPNATPYDGSDDALVGVVNSSGSTFSGSFKLTGSGIFGFEQDGICTYIKNSAIGAYCSGAYFQSDPGDYAGPGITFPNIKDSNTGTIAVAPLAAGATTFFSLEGSPSSISGGGGITVSGTLVVNSVNVGTVPLGGFLLGAIGVGGGSPPYTVTLVGTPPPGISGTSGGLAGSPTQPGNFSVLFTVLDSQGSRASGFVSYSVLGLTTTSLPTGFLSSPYLASLSVAGGNPPYTFTYSGLPAGLSGTSSGLIAGTVNTTVSANVIVTVTDKDGVTVAKTLPVTFVVPPPLAVTSVTLPGGTVGVPYSQGLNGVSGGAPPYTWARTSGTLPRGLRLSTNGAVTGIPTTIGTSTFNVRVTDVTGTSAVGSVSLTISPVAVTVNAFAPPAGMATIEYPQQTISASGGVQPYAFTVSSGTLPDGLNLAMNGSLTGRPTTPGLSTFNVTATDSLGTAGTAAFTVNIRPFTTDLVLSASSVNFNLAAGTSLLPAAQLVTVQSSAPGVVIPFALSIPPLAPNWFSFSPAGGTTPGAVNITLNGGAMGLPAATAPFTSTLSVTCLSPAQCAGSTQIVTVNVTVTATAPQLSVQSDLLSFTAVPGATQPLTQQVGLQNIGGGSVGFSSIACGTPLCTVTGVPGALTAGRTAFFTVTVDPTGRGGGYYRTDLMITASTGTFTIPVTLFVAGAPSVSLQPSGEQFQSLAGGVPTGPLTSFLIDASGSGTVNWTATVLPGAPWLVLPVTSGVASAAQPGVVNFSIDPGMAASLLPANYYGTIRITSTGVVDSPQDFEVVLNVGPANGAQRPNPSPAGLLFVSQAGTNPAAQTVSVPTSSTSIIPVQVSGSTTDTGNWLSVTPVTGSALPGAPFQTKIAATTAKLNPGTYYGSVNFAFPGLAVRSVNVTLIVSPAARAGDAVRALSGLAPQDGTPSCAPTLMAAVQTGLVNSFEQPTAWPTPLQILLVNDCGVPIPNGSVSASFSNGDPPLQLNLSDVRSGLYSGTWTPRATAQQTTINVRAAATGYATITTQLTGSVTPNSAPVLNRNSTQHIFNPLAAGGLAPGTLVQISGSGLASKSAMATTGPLPTSLNGTQVVIGGVLAPLTAVSPGSLTVEIPTGLTAGMQYQVIVNANGALTTPDQIQLTGTSPGVATVSSGLVSAAHADGTAVTEAAPAAPGEALVVTAAGLGLTDTPVADGIPAPATPVANALSMPTVTIDGTAAVVSQAILQPGMVGIYQIGFTVPASAKNGDLTLVVAQDGQPGNSTVLPVKAAK